MAEWYEGPYEVYSANERFYPGGRLLCTYPDLGSILNDLLRELREPDSQVDVSPRDLAEMWVVVRRYALSQLGDEIRDGYEPSIWFADSMVAGDVSEFPDMMKSLERLIGVPERDRLNWWDAVKELEAKAQEERQEANDG